MFRFIKEINDHSVIEVVGDVDSSNYRNETKNRISSYVCIDNVAHLIAQIILTSNKIHRYTQNGTTEIYACTSSRIPKP